MRMIIFIFDVATRKTAKIGRTYTAGSSKDNIASIRTWSWERSLAYAKFGFHLGCVAIITIYKPSRTNFTEIITIILTDLNLANIWNALRTNLESKRCQSSVSFLTNLPQHNRRLRKSTHHVSGQRRGEVGPPADPPLEHEVRIGQRHISESTTQTNRSVNRW